MLNQIQDLEQQPQFRLGEQFGNGIMSEVYIIHYSFENKPSHVLKVNNQPHDHQHELKVFKALQKLDSSLFPRLVDEYSL